MVLFGRFPPPKHVFLPLRPFLKWRHCVFLSFLRVCARLERLLITFYFISELRKQPVNPAVPMKPLYWSRIVVPVTAAAAAAAAPQPEPSSPSGTPNDLLWEKLEEAKIEDYSEFNELFSRQIITRKPTKKKTQEPSKQQAAKILDSKRPQNVGILSSSLHVDFTEIENAIYNFDTSVVNLEALQQIYEMVIILSTS